MADVTIRKGDRLPQLDRQFLLDGNAVDLTGSTVTFNLWNAATGTQVITNGACTIVTAATGDVRYLWTSTDATLPAGVYLGSFTAEFSSSRKMTAPNNGMIVIEIFAETASSFSYTGDPSARPIDTVRFLSGDTDAANPLVTDSEILFLLSQWNDDTYIAAAAVCDSAASKYSAKSDESKSVGDLSISTQYAAQSTNFATRAQSLRLQAGRFSPPSPTYANGAVGNFTFSVGMDTYQ
jgi:hypothetical protein